MKTRIFLPIVAILLAGCAGKPIESFESCRPLLDPEQYFAGQTHSWGIIETPSGQPREILHTSTTGRRDGGLLHFEQDILFQSGKKEHRSWLVRRQDAHHYTATGIIGAARGEAYGNVFHLDFTLDAIPGNPLARLHMSQWMYLQADGLTLVNRDTLAKAGIIVAEITEQFQKDR